MKSLLTGALLAIATVGSAGLAVAQEHTLTYATYLPQSLPFVQVDNWFMDEVEVRTEGRVTFERSYGGALLKAEEVIPGIGAGAADLGLGAAVYNSDVLPLSAGLFLPFITENADAAARAFTELTARNDLIQKEWRDSNLVPLYSMVASENTFWTNKAIHTAEDLQGMRIRAQGGVAQVLQLLGATPVALGAGDALQAFKSGAIDGVTSMPFDVGTLLGLQDIADFAGDTGRLGIYAAVTFSFNADTYNSLPEDIRAIISEVATDAPAKYLEVMSAAMDIAAEKIEAAPDLEIVRTSNEVDAAWRNQVRETVWNNWFEEMDARSVPGKETFEEFLELVAKYEEASTYMIGFDRLTEDSE